jgi:ferritin-like metal-binding protein YciE
MSISSMQELLVDQLRDLYSAEKQLTKALPKLAKASKNPELAQGFRDHLEQTRGHVQRIEQIFEILGQKAKSKPCEAMKGLVAEGQEAIEEDLDPETKNIALIAAARRVEHYEMAAYGTLVMAAQAMKQPEIAKLLQATLQEETETDKKLVASGKTLLKEAVRPDGDVPAKPSVKASSNGASKKSSGDGHLSHTTSDHDEIRQMG